MMHHQWEAQNGPNYDNGGVCIAMSRHRLLACIFTCASIGSLVGDRHFAASAQDKEGRGSSPGLSTQWQLPWIRRTDPVRSDGVIVFVHGVTGNARTTWSSGGSYWPELLARDEAFNGQDVYAYGYPSPRLAKSLSIDELADNLRLILSTDGVLSYKQITFVCHSMGGLVTRSFLLKYRDIAPRVRFLYFFATPTTGSPFAALARLVSKNPQFGGMYPVNDPDSYLATIQSAWLAAHLGLRSYCAYETQPLWGQLVIVGKDSATHLCTERLDPIDADHINIVKPADKNSNPYRALKEAFLETVPPTGQKPKEPVPLSPNKRQVRTPKPIQQEVDNKGPYPTQKSRRPNSPGTATLVPKVEVTAGKPGAAPTVVDGRIPGTRDWQSPFQGVLSGIGGGSFHIRSFRVANFDGVPYVKDIRLVDTDNYAKQYLNLNLVARINFVPMQAEEKLIACHADMLPCLNRKADVLLRDGTELKGIYMWVHGLTAYSSDGDPIELNDRKYDLFSVVRDTSNSSRPLNQQVIWFAMETGDLPRGQEWREAKRAMVAQLESAGFTVADRPIVHSAVVRVHYTDKCFAGCGATLILEKPDGHKLIEEDTVWFPREGANRYNTFKGLGELALALLTNDATPLVNIARSDESCTSVRRLARVPTNAVVKVLVDLLAEENRCASAAAEALCMMASSHQERVLFSPLFDSNLAKDWAAREISKSVDYFVVAEVKKGGAWLLGEIGDPAGLPTLNRITAPDLQPMVVRAKSKISKRANE
jgi:pimeloyl-ACP methyl ester carboxylesterase